MNPHRVHILNGTYDYNIIVFISKKFELVLFPSNQSFVNKHLVNWRCFKATGQEFIKLFGSINKCSTRTTKGKRRTNYEWEAEFLSDFFSFQKRSCNFSWSYRNVDSLQQLFELFAIFCNVDCININTD